MSIYKITNMTKVKIQTTLGDIIVRLYDETPLHRDNFLKLAKEGYYDGTIFHRVIKDFMIQGGDPDSKNPAPNGRYGTGGPDYTIEAEIKPELIHKRGALAAARQGDEVNPERRSSGSQFYIVWGERMRPAPLQRAMSHLAEKGIELDRFMINDYQMRGGTPHLDGTYTVFGRVIEGLDVVEAIQAVATDANDRPLEDVTIIRAVVEQRSLEAKAVKK